MVGAALSGLARVAVVGGISVGSSPTVRPRGATAPGYQILIVASWLAVKSRAPSGLHARAWIGRSWAGIVRSSWPLTAFQMCRLLSRVEAMRDPSGDQAASCANASGPGN